MEFAGAEWGCELRFVCILMLLVAAVPELWAQMEPCLTGTDAPGCGIKITLNPPLSSSNRTVLSVPSEVTIEVPLRLHPTRVRLNSGPAGAEVGEQFKMFAETSHYKKANGIARFRMEIKSCPATDTALTFSIVTERLPYPIAANATPFECKQGTPQ